MATDLLTAVDYWRLAKIYPFKAELKAKRGISQNSAERKDASAPR